MDNLEWLVEHRFREVIRYESTWDFVFDDEAVINTGCLWRFVKSGRIRLTSEDDGHRFGLPGPVNAVLTLNQALAGAKVVSVTLTDGTLDLEIRLTTGHALQIIPDSSGYEAWQASKPGWSCFAQGGGNLVIFDDGSPNSQNPASD
jgi:hypothetical protein